MMLAMKEHGLTIAEYSPSQVKLAVTGYGKATKGQVGHMVQLLLSMQRIPRPDDEVPILRKRRSPGRRLVGFRSG